MAKISIITPLHEPGNKYIKETYACLKAQTIEDWEWIVLENHGGKLPTSIRKDPRVKVYVSELKGIGALKQAACKLASTDYLVELDNDDLITETTLERVLEAFNNGADFVHSDSAEFQDESWDKEWGAYPYGARYGWSKYEVEYKGHTLYAMNAPEVNAQNIRLIDWSPNHVRAWRKTVYDKLGGHDPTLKVADDHDLIVRFFLANAKFIHIPECLYFYRVHAKNTVKTDNGAIRNNTKGVYNKYIWRLAEHFANTNNLLKVDLCGAVNPSPGYLILDKYGNPSCDLNEKWPLPDNSVGMIRANDAVEHLPNAIHTMNEAYRILAPGGFFMIDVPSTNGLGAFCDPTHKSFWNKLSFRYYTETQYKIFVPEFTGKFQSMHLIEWFPSNWHRQENVPYVQAQLIALKPGYHPMGYVG